MPRKKRSISPNYDMDDDEYDDDASSNGSRHNNNNPPQRNAANARERARMRILSSAFCRLKTKLPWVPADTKLSKLDTLRLATTYIQQLGALLDGEADQVDSNMPQKLTWPFHFQQPPEQKQLSQSSSSSGSEQWMRSPGREERISEIPLTIVNFRDGNNSVYNSILHGQ